MRVPRHARVSSTGINMTPMIDVIFQLIIFFLVSSHLARQEAQLELPLPIAESGRAPVESESSRHIVLNVLEEGTILLAGRTVPLAELEARLRRLQEDRGGATEVKIRAHRGVTYRHVEPIMLACHRSGMRQVTYSVYRSQDVR
jgi:biopolymer transport protein ExbD